MEIRMSSMMYGETNFGPRTITIREGVNGLEIAISSTSSTSIHSYPTCWYRLEEDEVNRLDEFIRKFRENDDLAREE